MHNTSVYMCVCLSVCVCMCDERGGDIIINYDYAILSHLYKACVSHGAGTGKDFSLIVDS